MRLDLVKVVSMGVLSDLKGKADNAFKDMNDWLGARFLKEMERYALKYNVAVQILVQCFLWPSSLILHGQKSFYCP